MFKLWVWNVFLSALTKGKAGVQNLIHKKYPFELVSTVNYVEWRLLTLHVRVASRDLIVTNVYACNSPTKSFFQSVYTNLTPFLHSPIVLGGEFNSVIEPH